MHIAREGVGMALINPGPASMKKAIHFLINLIPECEKDLSLLSEILSFQGIENGTTCQQRYSYFVSSLDAIVPNVI